MAIILELSFAKLLVRIGVEKFVISVCHFRRYFEKFRFLSFYYLNFCLTKNSKSRKRVYTLSLILAFSDLHKIAAANEFNTQNVKVELLR